MTHRLADLAAMVGAELVGDPDRLIDGVATLEAAGERDLSFLTNTRYREQARSSEAGAILVSSAMSPDTLGGLGVDLVVCDDAYRALADLVTALFPVPEVESGVHETACVDATAELAPISTSSSITTTPTWGSLTCDAAASPSAKPNPSAPSTTPEWMITRSPIRLPS